MAKTFKVTVEEDDPLSDGLVKIIAALILIAIPMWGIDAAWHGITGRHLFSAFEKKASKIDAASAQNAMAADASNMSAASGDDESAAEAQDLARDDADAQPAAVADAAPLPAPREAEMLVPRASLITSDDYPALSLRNGEQGSVRAMWLVGADGRASDCKIAESSGSSRLDQATCGLLMKRLRYAPKIGENGQPTASTDTVRMTWTLPGDRAPASAPAAATPAAAPAAARQTASPSIGERCRAAWDSYGTQVQALVAKQDAPAQTLSAVSGNVGFLIRNYGARLAIVRSAEDCQTVSQQGIADIKRAVSPLER